MKYLLFLLPLALDILPVAAAEKTAAKPIEIPPLQTLALKAIESDFCNTISFVQLSRTDHDTQKKIVAIIRKNKGLPQPKRNFFAKEVRNFKNLSSEKYKKSRAVLEKLL
jgi:hypothetical protein